MSTDIAISRESAILTIKLDRQSKKNAVTRAMYSAMATALREAASDDSTKVVVFKGDRDFSSGNDLVDFLEVPPSDHDAPVFQFMMALSECPLPVVAAVDGFAVGIGSTLLPHCDFIYASDRAQFMMPFINLNLRPEFGSTQLLPQLAGYPMAAEMLLLGEKFDAATALQARLITAIVAPEELDAKVAEVAHKLAGKLRPALIETKQLLRRQAEPMAERIKVEGAAFMATLSTDETKAAFNKILHR
ncbi:enoyl-CoA hydratase [Gammaproteobacteria bacterium LSUCC0057]|uniref:Enoyl-CoA hydratase n=1 Tax=Gammaproteobacteria bacterium LSUCC0057 TaxID=2559237 RepID=A0A4Y8UMR2_9GAMM|nr:enoyl-CoA hydratase [Gammaproteobacteria bacterium LSUCC0057]